MLNQQSVPTIIIMLACSFSCSDDSGTVNTPDAGAVDSGDDTDSYLLQAWADNWFAMYIGDTLIVEDSVSITTERSFNAEEAIFSATRPFVASLILKDFKETDSGLEYIGEGNQQMGDGGFILQIKENSTGEIIGVSNSDWKCLVIHEAPLNKECANSATPDTDCEFRSDSEPDGWKEANFDDSAWVSATEHTEADVSPKDGYNRITWDSTAKLIWGADLESDNTILCRVSID
ncbi:MAG: PEBP family protein [Myxococcales bacterium]|nr:PEBP family protein [Myxococcales bacterium]